MVCATDGIILKVSTYRESDILAILLTQQLGKIICVARSAKKSKHRFFSGIEMLDAGIFNISKNKANRFQIDSIAKKESLHKGIMHPKKFLFACLCAEMYDACVPEEDTEYGALVAVLKKTLEFLHKSESPQHMIMCTTWALLKLSIFSGIDPRENMTFFRADDLGWITGLCNDSFVTYEPDEAAKRALCHTVMHIEKVFDVRSKVLKEIIKN